MPSRSAPAPDLIARFAAIVGPGNAFADPESTQSYLVERRDAHFGRTPLVLSPRSTAEVAAILKLASETGTAIVPQGGNTGLVGGQIPDATGTEIVLSLARLDRIRRVEPEGDVMIVEAGVTLAAARAAAEAADRHFPLAIGSMHQCQIGGNVSTNAGGVAVLSYGNTRDLVFGLEVVLADGEIWDGLRTLRKDNAGYDLKHLFIGAEGTLGIITAVALKLSPRPRGKAAAFLGVASPDDALALLPIAKGIAGGELTSFELLSRLSLEVCLRHLPGAVDPLPQTHPWYVLIEVSSGRSEGDARESVEAIVAAGAGCFLTAHVAAGDAERQAWWRMRFAISDMQKPEGAGIKHDISVPVHRVPAFLAAGIAAVAAIVPGIRPVPFGHLGDGNIHFNFLQPVGADKAAFLEKSREVHAAVYALVADFGGSIAAEHGIGRTKRDLLPTVRSPLEVRLMRQVKAMLDPGGILNPGKVL